jgi:maltooligosyltrehalose trehalohydrolase
MLFMGQEWAASAPFLFFADHERPLADQVDHGRRDFLRQFPSIAVESVLAAVPRPSDPSTFAASQLDHDERRQRPHAQWLALHRDLLALRRARDSRPDGDEVDGAVLTGDAFCVRLFPRGGVPGTGADERLLLVNLGARVELVPAPEPLLAPPAGMRWHVELSTDDPAYGGGGAPEPETDDGWILPAEAAVLLRPDRLA